MKTFTKWIYKDTRLPVQGRCAISQQPDGTWTEAGQVVEQVQSDPPVIYLIGSLRNPNVPVIATRLREAGYEVFDDWHAAGPEADDEWRRYEKDRGHDYPMALRGHAARHVYEYDRHHLDRSNAGVLLMPAGKSGHLEFGYLIGQGKPGFILFDEEPERWDVMYQFANLVCFDIGALVGRLEETL